LAVLAANQIRCNCPQKRIAKITKARLHSAGLQKKRENNKNGGNNCGDPRCCS
jgi:hypothetical protein